MSFKVFPISNLAELESLPVALIAHYPTERRDYKPYAQCNICLDGHTLFLRMWAFEVSPPPGSCLRCLLYIFPGREYTALSVTIGPDNTSSFTLLENGGEQAVNPPEGFIAHPHNGEDLQGIYWGSLIPLPIDWLQSLGGAVNTQAGSRFYGNFYKLCPGPKMAHSGSFFAANFPENPFRRESMGEFLVV